MYIEKPADLIHELVVSSHCCVSGLPGSTDADADADAEAAAAVRGEREGARGEVAVTGAETGPVGASVADASVLAVAPFPDCVRE